MVDRPPNSTLMAVKYAFAAPGIKEFDLKLHLRLNTSIMQIARSTRLRYVALRVSNSCPLFG